MSPRYLLPVFLLVALTVGLAGSAQAVTIRSWDDATQRGGDLYNAGTGALEYSAFEAGLIGQGHTVLPGVSMLTAANLAEVDVFFHGASSHILAGSEQSALAAFVQGGGYLIVEANSNTSEQQSGNSALGALGLGSPYTGITGGNQGPNAGLFSNNTTCATVGPLGDLRGQSFGSSLCVHINSTGGTIVGTNVSTDSWVEFTPYTGGGRVLVCGDPYAFNLFMQPGASHYNPNNLSAYLNFVWCAEGATPVTPTTWGAIKSTYGD